jgi:23S rRNA pseudouridine1911/1915/1917 synthase
MREETYVVPAEHDQERLDKGLMLLSNETRTTLQSFIESGYVTLNGAVVRKASTKLKIDDVLVLHRPEAQPLTLEPAAIPLDILYEDDAVLVVNKPSGMIVHPTPTTQDVTLVHALLHLPIAWDAFGETLRPGIVHRLDKDTSGLLLVAKTKEALLALQAMLKKRHLKREYVALVEGVIPHERGTIEAPVGRHPKKRQQMSVVSSGKEARTHFEVLKRYPEHTLIRCQLDTGRTHQIRVHLQYIDHPVVGDPLYGYRKHVVKTGQLLHAFRLTFEHPLTGKSICIEAPYPPEITQAIAALDAGKDVIEELS